MKARIRRSRSVRLSVEILESRKLLAGLVANNDSSQSLWSFPDSASITKELSVQFRATDFRLANLDKTSIQDYLSLAPSSLSNSASTHDTLAIPKPDGGFERFQIYVSPIMAPELAAKFPEIQTYAGQGLDDPAATIRFDVTPQGFHGQVRSPSGTYYIDPYSNLPSNFYAVYARESMIKPSFPELELSDLVSKHEDIANSGTGTLDGTTANRNESAQNRSGAQLRTYRLAVAATGEYTTFHGGTVALGQAAIVTAINRVAGIYQTEATISFQLVANNDQLVYTNAATDPYTNNNGLTMLGENQTNVDRVIGNANYDIGHVFSTGGGGVASLGSVGINAVKAQGVTGLPAPIADAFYVDYVAHEIGHQFGGNHTFNSNAGSCTGNRNPSTAYEPGSGTTIQAYAGICDTDNLQPNSDPYFHSASLDEFVRHVDVTIPRVGTRTNTGNNIPVVDAGADFTIPARTPFELTAVGSDADAGDRLTYDWQQRDLGSTQPVTAGDNGVGPLFRVWSPTISSSRTFPRLSDLVNNRTAVGERLPTTNRQMNFRVIARDNRISGGAFDDDNMRVTVVDTGKPFAVLTPNTNVSWEGLTLRTVTWDVAGTDANGINASKVDISMSTDGGLTYPLKLVTGVANNGSAVVRIPNIPTTTARIRVQAASNIFFDISDANFTVTPASQTISITLGSSLSFNEDSPPVIVAPSASLSTFNVNTFDGGTLTVAIGINYEAGDAIAIASQGTNAGQVSAIGTDIAYAGTVFATYTVSAQSLVFSLNTKATNVSISALLSRVSFVHSTNDPTLSTRELTAYLDNGTNGASNRATVFVTVIPSNDPPQMRSVSLAPINEDTINPTGISVGNLVGPGFLDPDRGSSLSGIVVTANFATLATPTTGDWQFSIDRSIWSAIGNVTPTSGLVLDVQSFVRFVPARDFFGSPVPLAYYGLDETFIGLFTSNTKAFFDVTTATGTGPVSLASANIGIVINPINDAPIATVGSQKLSTLEDQPLSFVMPTAWFFDVDDPTPTLAYSAEQPLGLPLPSWLTFDPATRRLTGTPTNSEVGEYALAFRAKDKAGASVALPFALTVVNVNDVPTSIQLISDPVPENTPGVLIGRLFGIDPDRTDEFIWTVADSRFTVVQNSIYLKQGENLDYEENRQVSFMVRGTDTGTPPLFLDQQVTIDIIDVNEFAPALTGTFLTIKETTSETNAGPVVVGNLVARDGDTANKVRFRFVGTPPTQFSLNQDTGRITLAPNSVLDHESTRSFQFFVEAFDNGLPQLATTASVNVSVTDVNEFDPNFLTESISVSENQVTNSAFTRIVASDGDTSQTIKYSLLPSETRFSIDPVSGDLSLIRRGTFDYEVKQVDSIVVIATDSGVPSKTTQRQIPIQVLDANDPPTGASVPKTDILSNVTGLDFGAIVIADQDVGQKYSIVSLDDRFVVIAGHLIVAPGKSVGNTDALQIVVPLIATETAPGTGAYPLSLNMTRITNARPWQNQANPLNVDRTTSVNPLDVLALVNGINGSLAGRLPFPRPADTLQLPDYDVDGNGRLEPLDVLVVINFLNASGSGESEGAAPMVEKSPRVVDNEWLTAYTQFEEERAIERRKKV